MADESGGDGIIQSIKLALDQASLERLSHDAAAAGVSVATQIQQALDKSGVNTNTAASVMKLVLRVRDQFEKGMTGIHTKLLKDMIDIPEAERAAAELARKINAKLTEGLAKTSISGKPFVQAKILETAMIRPSDIRVVDASKARQQLKAEKDVAAIRKQTNDILVEEDNSAEFAAIMAEKTSAKDLAAAAAQAKETEALKLQVSNRLDQLDLVRKEFGLTKELNDEYTKLAHESERLGLDERARVANLHRRTAKANDLFNEMGMPGMLTEGIPGESRSERAQRLGLDLRARARARTAKDQLIAAQTAEANARAADKDKLTPVASARPGDIATRQLEEVRMNRDTAEARRRQDLAVQKRAEAEQLLIKQTAHAEAIARENERERNLQREKEEREEQRRNYRERVNAQRRLGEGPIDITSTDAERSRRLQQEIIRRRQHEEIGAEMDPVLRDKLSRAAIAKTWARYYDQMPAGATRENTLLDKPPQFGPNIAAGHFPQPPADLGTVGNKIRGLIPAAWKDAFEKASATVRREMSGETRTVGDAADRMQASIKKGLLIDDDTVEKNKNKLKGMFSLYKVPEARQPNSVEAKRLSDASSGWQDTQRRTGIFVAENQLAGAKPTLLGRSLSALGVDIRKWSPTVSGLTDKLKDLGVSSGRIGQILPPVGGAMKGVTSATLGLVKSFGLLYTAHRIVSFLKETISVSNDNEVSFTRLSTTLGDFGLRMSQASKTFMPMFDSQAKLGITYQQSAEYLARLVQVTGNYDKSLRALPIIQDIVASGYMTMEQATRATGRAIIGDIGNFSRYGIVLDKTKDVLDQLTKRFGGELLQRSKTFSGQLGIMSVQWQNFMIVLGDTLKQSDEGVGVFTTIIDMLSQMKQWIKDNAVAVKLFGAIIITAFAAIGVAIFAVVATLVTMLKVIGSVGVLIRQTFISLPAMFVEIWTDSMLLIVKSFRMLGVAVDAIFNAIAKKTGSSIRSHIGQAFDDTIKRAEDIRKDARKTVQKNADEGGQMLSDIWKNTYQAPGVPDAPVGPGIHIRKEHNARAIDINRAKKNLLSDNARRSKMGEDALVEIEKVVNERIVEAQKEKNQEEERLLNNELEAIDKARKAREKKNNQSLAEQTRFNKELARLAEIAKNRTDEKSAIMAVDQLTKMHTKLIAARAKLKAGSEAWLVVEANISHVEDAIRGRLELQDELYEKRLKRLHNMVELGVDEEDAVKSLQKMYDDAEKAAQDAEKAAKDSTLSQQAHNDAVDEAIRQRLRMSQIESAMSSRSGRRNEQVDELEKDMLDPEKREATERKLRSIQSRAEKDAASGRTDHIKQENKALAERVRLILEGNKAEMKDIGKSISAGEELLKHGRTRAEGLDILKKAEADILELLKKENLTLTEQEDLKAKLAKVHLDIKKADEPALDMLQSLQDVFEEKGPDMIKEFAATMTDVMDNAFQMIMKDSRNLGDALRSAPKGFARAMLSELAAMAKGKAMENLAWAIEETAKGLSDFAGVATAPLAAAHFHSAAQHTLAAAKWGLLGAAAGSMAGGGAGGYSSGRDSASSDRGGNSTNTGHGPDIYLQIDGVDPANPRHQQLIGESQRQYEERYGGKIVYSTGK